MDPNVGIGQAGEPSLLRALGQLLDEHAFDSFVEAKCRRFYAAVMGRPSVAPGVYFRLLLIGYFEGIDSERGIAWRAADSLALRSFLGIGLAENTPDHSTISRTRRLIDLETHREVFGGCWVPGRVQWTGTAARGAAGPGRAAATSGGDSRLVVPNPAAALRRFGDKPVNLDCMIGGSCSPPASEWPVNCLRSTGYTDRLPRGPVSLRSPWAAYGLRLRVWKLRAVAW